MKSIVTTTLAMFFVIVLPSSSFCQEPEQEKIDASVHNSVLQANRRFNEALNRPANFDYFETRFADIIDELKSEYMVPFVIDESAIENNLDEDQPITLTLNGVSLRSALRIMLTSYQCSYLVADEVIYIMSDDQAAQRLETRIFDCRRIIESMAGDSDANSEKLIKVFQATIDPQSWESNGGSGSVTEIGGLFVTTQSAHNQLLIEELLDELELRVIGDLTDAVSAGK